MQDKTMYLLVESSVVPEVFLKVVHVKKLMAQGKAKNLTEATKIANISRSAFYRYRDSVFEYEDKRERTVINIYAQLLDEAGVLSSLLTELGKIGANVLTINQSIPIDGVAQVTIAARIKGSKQQVNRWITQLSKIYGIVEIKLLNG